MNKINNPEIQRPVWMKPENFRWAAWQWEQLIHLKRLGGRYTPFFSFSEWTPEWYKRLFACEDSLQMLKDLGINVISTRFYKGYGIEAERTEREEMYEFVERCHHYGIRVMAYINTHTIFYETFLLEDPDMAKRFMIRRNGNWRETSTGVSHGVLMCLNYQENMKLLKRVIHMAYREGHYDGYHFDRWDLFPCYCPLCEKLFKEYLRENINDKDQLGFLNFDYVKQPPLWLNDPDCDEVYRESVMTQDPVYHEWTAFRVLRGIQQQRELYDFVKSLSPELGTMFNGGFDCSDGFAPQGGTFPYFLAKHTDTNCLEGGRWPRFDGKTLFSQIHGMKLAAAAGTYLICSEWISGEAGLSGVKLPKKAEEVKLNIAETAAMNGLNCCTWGNRTLGGDKIVFDIKELADAHRLYVKFLNTNRELYTDAVENCETAILYSYESTSFGGHGVFKSVITMETILQRQRIPFSIVFNQDIMNIFKYKFLIIPNQLALSDDEVKVIEKFLVASGKVLATGDSAVFNQHLLRRKEAPFAALAANPNLVFLKNALELESEKTSVGFFPPVYGTSPPREKVITDTIASLFPENQRAIQLYADSLVTFEPKRLPSGIEVIHLLNYDNLKKKASGLILQFNQERFKIAKLTLLVPERTSSEILRMNSNGSLVIPEFETYALLKIEKVTE